MLWPGLFAVALQAALLYSAHFRILRQLNYNDFGKFYYSLQQWRDAGTLYGPSPATLLPFGQGRTEHLWNMNPPHFHALIWPLVYFRIEDAYAIWTAINIAVAAVTLAAIARAIPIRSTATGWLVGLVLAAASAPALASAITGQLTGLFFGAVTWIWLALRRGQWRRAGLAIGLVCSVKPFLGLLGLYLLIRGQRRAALIAAVSLGSAFALGFVAFGAGAHRDWLMALREAHWIGAVMNASIYGLVGRTWSLDVFATPAMPNVVATGLALILLTAGMFAAWRARDVDRGVLLVLLTSLLASPLGWVYYVPIVAGPALALRASGQLSAWLFPALAGLMVPQLWIWPFPTRIFAFTLGSVYTWSLLTLWILAAWPGAREVVRPADGLDRSLV